MERSEIRERQCSGASPAPDYAEFIIGPAESRTRWLHPGYHEYHARTRISGGSRHMRHLSIKATALAFAAVAATATLAGAQQDSPTKPIRFIATEVVGSATDIQARIIAKGMAQVLGQPIEIENLFGEAGVRKGIQSPPEGYTIV